MNLCFYISMRVSYMCLFLSLQRLEHQAQLNQQASSSTLTSSPSSASIANKRFNPLEFPLTKVKRIMQIMMKEHDRDEDDISSGNHSTKKKGSSGHGSIRIRCAKESVVAMRRAMVCVYNVYISYKHLYYDYNYILYFISCILLHSLRNPLFST